jgi:hypothetical protein
MSNNDLKHYGILGMKWGVRRKLDQKTIKKSKSKKLLDKINSRKKSEEQVELEKKYIKKGLTKDEASIEAYKNILTKKILIAAGATILVAGVSYAIYKGHREETIDKVIKSDTLIQTITTDANLGVRDAFYGADKTFDKIKYKGLYGEQLRDGDALLNFITGNKSGPQEVYSKSVKVISDIKTASPKNAMETLKALADKDPEFKSQLTKQIPRAKLALGQNYYMKVTGAEVALANGKVNKNVYEVFNALLVDHSPAQQTLTDKFYKELASKGYNAIKDINDSKYSGYNASNPLIIFNHAGKVAVSSVKQLTNNEMDKYKNIILAKELGDATVVNGSLIAGTILARNALRKKKISEIDRKE